MLLHAFSHQRIHRVTLPHHSKAEKSAHGMKTRFKMFYRHQRSVYHTQEAVWFGRGHCNTVVLHAENSKVSYGS